MKKRQFLKLICLASVLKIRSGQRSLAEDIAAIIKETQMRYEEQDARIREIIRTVFHEPA